MKLISQVYSLSLLFSLGSIIGVSIWANSNNVLTLSSSYSFYWFVAITSFLVSLQLYCSHTIQFMINYTKQNIELLTLHSYVIPVFAGIYTIFWLGAAAGVASDLRYCLYIKRNIGLGRFYYDEFNCNGEIVSTIFGFANFIVWCTIIYYGGSHWYNKYQTTTTSIPQTPNAHDKIEMTETSSQPQTEVQVETSSEVQTEVQGIELVESNDQVQGIELVENSEGKLTEV